MTEPIRGRWWNPDVAYTALLAGLGMGLFDLLMERLLVDWPRVRHGAMLVAMFVVGMGVVAASARRRSSTR